LDNLEQITRHVTRESRDPTWRVFATVGVVSVPLLLVLGLPIWLLERWDDWRRARWAERSFR
jgi:hypothetical protein